MSVHTMRLVMGILFLGLATVLFTRQWLLPDLNNRFNPLRMNLGAILALIFGCLNLARWYAVWAFKKGARTAVRYPLQPDPSAAPQVLPNPDLDFTKPQNTENTELDKQPETRQERST